MIKNQEKYTQQLLETIVDGMQELKAHEIKILDLRKIPNAVADYFVVCHGTSTTQVEAIANSIIDETITQLHDKPWHKEGMDNARWILIDYVNIVAHVFHQEAREFYDIENLWADANTTSIQYQD